MYAFTLVFDPHFKLDALTAPFVSQGLVVVRNLLEAEVRWAAGPVFISILAVQCS